MSASRLGGPQVVTYASQSLTFTPYDVRWVPRSCRVCVVGATARATGVVQVYQIEQSADNTGSAASLVLSSEVTKATPFKCGTFGASSYETRQLATGDFSGRLSIWDLENAAIPVYSVKAHAGIVNSIDGLGGLNIGKGAPEIATGGRDGRVCLWDPRTPNPVLEVTPAQSAGAPDCWAVCLGGAHTESDRCLAAGYDSGDVRLWDLRSPSEPLWNSSAGDGVCGISFDRKDIPANKLLVSTLGAQLRAYDLRGPQHNPACATTRGGPLGNGTAWCVRPLPQNREVCACTSGNGAVALFKYEYPPQRTRKVSTKQKTIKDGQEVEEVVEEEEGVAGTLAELGSAEVSSQPVVAFDWCAEQLGLCACVALDQTLRVVIVTKLHKL
eukprot:TRINITY_DN18527_c0_g1_i1.p1 TRINITY_DN18527_c0_g1~~TRINITY_DN18527_c0_g1_i1.p1  ORF type:complete len:384 (-),score=78.95 TRINITY_DN18527_c0_g1_i1:26-1177(-)